MHIDIQKEQHGLLLRLFLQRELGLSSKMIKHLKFQPNGITVNGYQVTVRHVLSAGELLSLAIEDTESAPLERTPLPLEILYEDAHLVVPSKPANMPTHPSHGHHGDTVANALAYRYASLGIPFVFRPINRLDRNTSGLLLIARSRPAAGKLTQAMQEGKIRKTYLAILDGEMTVPHGRIDSCLHRTQKSIILRETCPPDAPDADTALTEYRVLRVQNKHTLVEASPITGRTHQLRVHFSSIGFPITGDDLYGTPSEVIGRHALHAYTLCFPHPETAAPLCVTAPPPADFLAALEAFFPDWEHSFRGKEPI